MLEIEMVRKTLRTIKIPIFLLLTTASYSAALSAQTPGNVSLGFGGLKSDTEVENLVERHRLLPMKAHTWLAGFSGSHSRDINKGDYNSARFIEDTREETVNFFSEALLGNTVRLANVLEAYSETEITADDELNSRLRGLLNLRSQISSALDIAQSNEPIIYAVTVEGENSNKISARSDSIVFDSIGSELFFQNKAPGNLLRPTELTNEYNDARVQNARNEEIFTTISDIVKNNPVRADGRLGALQHDQ